MLLDFIQRRNITIDFDEPQVCTVENLGCYEGLCLNGGSCDGDSGKCKCLRLFTGPRCQYKGKKLNNIISKCNQSNS